MAYCENCKTKITCSCQRATAEDGKKVCTNCLDSYNNQIGSSSKTPIRKQGQIKATYNGPGEQLGSL